jgi:hypothetical protein
VVRNRSRQESQRRNSDAADGTGNKRIDAEALTPALCTLHPAPCTLYPRRKPRTPRDARGVSHYEAGAELAPGPIRQTCRSLPFTIQICGSLSSLQLPMSPRTRTGTGLLFSVPSPNSPWSFLPQHQALPSTARPQAWSAPTATEANSIPPLTGIGVVEQSRPLGQVSALGPPRLPFLLLPQHHA